MKWAVVAVVAGLALAAAALRRYTVADPSMIPAFAPGDRVLVERLTLRFRPAREGDVVVVRNPPAGPALLLKRVSKVHPGGSLRDTAYQVLGDNLGASTDSRSFGPVSHRGLVGRVWFRY